MSGGYQIVEPSILDPLVVEPRWQGLAAALLESVAVEISAALEGHVRVEVIVVTYHGSYPALGLRYADPTGADVGPLVEAMAERLLVERGIDRFVALLQGDRGAR